MLPFPHRNANAGERASAATEPTLGAVTRAGASVLGSQLLYGTAHALCSFFKFFLLIAGFHCLEIKSRHMKLKEELPNPTLYVRSKGKNKETFIEHLNKFRSVLGYRYPAGWDLIQLN